MIPVSEETRNSYIKDGKRKKLKITIDGVEIDNDLIYDESMKLTESILNKNTIEFVGCIPSIFEIQIYRFQNDVKNKFITASITSNETDEIPLFSGYIDSAKMQTNHKYKKIIAYDVLYSRGNIDVSFWYNTLEFPTTLKNIRNSLFEYIGIKQVEIQLPNDEIIIDKQYNPTKLKALDVIKAICQLNGVFGIINRYGKMEYRSVVVLNDLLYPSFDLFPGDDLFPGSVTGESYISNYNTMDYQEYTVKPVDSIVIRDNDDEFGVQIGEGQNIYIIQGNMFSYNLDVPAKFNILNNIYDSISIFKYIPFDSECKGYPFIEVGDTIRYLVRNYYTDKLEYQEYTIMKRTLSGIQFLEDEYEADGEEYVNEFLSDVSVSIDKLQDEVTSLKTSVNSLKSQVSNGLKCRSVQAVPETWENNTIYLVQGEVVVK